MDFEPKPGMRIKLDIDNTIEFTSLEPSGPAKDFVYAEIGKEGTVYKVLKGKDYYALKVFHTGYWNKNLVGGNVDLRHLSHLGGLRAADRIIINKSTHPSVIEAFPGLEHSIVMPWIQGNIWGNLMINELPLKNKEYHQIAKLFLRAVCNLENTGLAHCDLSNNNFIIDSKLRFVELIDIENMFLPQIMQLPTFEFSYGTPGYRTKWIAEKGVWEENGDRFSAAILCSEILSWHEKEIRENRSSDASFFDPDEIGGNCKRYLLMKETLRKSNNILSDLFEQAWFSHNLEQCPSINDWAKAVEGIFEENFELETTKVLHERIFSNELGIAKEKAKNDKVEEDKIKTGLPDIKNPNKTNAILIFAYIFLGFLFLGMVFSAGLLEMAFKPTFLVSPQFAIGINFMYYVGSSSIYTSILCFVVGILQLMALRNKVNTNKGVFLLADLFSGFLGGAFGSTALFIFGWFDLISNPSFSELIFLSVKWTFAGLFVGVMSGLIIGLVNAITKNYIVNFASSQRRWFFYNLISWSMIYSIGLAINLGLSILFGFPALGDAISSFVIVVLHGIGIVVLINLSPNIEIPQL